MTIDENLKDVTGGVALLGEVMKAAGDNPQVKEAGNELGKTVLTVTKTINHCLLPLAAFNFGIEKAKKYFAERFPNDMAQKAAKIPPEEIIEPKASIAGPALQGLAFCYEEQDLKEMYLNLLASAMDGRMADSAHPAFVEIIKQLSAKEAKLITTTLRSSSGLPIVELRLNLSAAKGYNILVSHVLDLKSTDTQEPVEDKTMPVMVDNWVRLGLVNVTYQAHLIDESLYGWVKDRPEFQRHQIAPLIDGQSVTFQKGILVRTAFGKQFANAVGL